MPDKLDTPTTPLPDTFPSMEASAPTATITATIPYLDEVLRFDAPAAPAPAPAAPLPPAAPAIMISHNHWQGFSGAPLEAYSAFPRWLVRHDYGEQSRSDSEWGKLFTEFMNSVPE